MKLRNQIEWRQIADGKGYLFDPRTGSLHGLNPTSTIIVEKLQAGIDANTLINILCEEYEIDELAARDEVLTFVHLLQEQDLVEL